MKNSLGRKEIKAMAKAVVHAKTDRVLGLHMVGAEVAEILQVCPSTGTFYATNLIVHYRSFRRLAPFCLVNVSSRECSITDTGGHY